MYPWSPLLLYRCDSVPALTASFLSDDQTTTAAEEKMKRAPASGGDPVGLTAQPGPTLSEASISFIQSIADPLNFCPFDWFIYISV